MADGPAQLVSELRADIRDGRVLQAVGAVPRDVFVPPELRADAWRNAPLPIGEGQTISQPLMVARMCELLELTGAERVLDIGTGSGYHAAILARLARWVWSIERREALSAAAAHSLQAADVRNVTLVVGDGSLGLPAQAPFDAINVAAAGPVGRLQLLERQLGPGGRLVAPVQDRDQRLVLVRRTEDGRLVRRTLERVRFVPLVRG